ncbi:MAG: DUF58 domain-containing protein [Planctomycetota bacterium]|jgi:uncharacterized protein (DUF58 family)
MEFDEVREYAPGDEIRSIDWNVTARTGHPYVKRYVEERELTLLFLLDLSASGSFGTRTQSKNEMAAELCALLAFSAIKNNDKVGMIVFTDRIEHFIPPRKGTSHVLRIIREVLCFEPHGTGTDIHAALEYLAKVQSKRCIAFLLSDFQDQGFEKSLRIVSRRHDLIALSLTDPSEEQLPEAGLILLEDAETGERVTVDSSDPAVRRRYAAAAHARRQSLVEMLRRMSVDHAPIRVGDDYVRDLIAFFRVRERRQ